LGEREKRKTRVRSNRRGKEKTPLKDMDVSELPSEGLGAKKAAHKAGPYLLGRRRKGTPKRKGGRPRKKRSAVVKDENNTQTKEKRKKPLNASEVWQGK